MAEDTCKFVQYHTSKMYNNPHKDSATINLCFKMACLLGRIQTSLALLSLHFAIATPKINFFHQIQVLVKNHTALFGKTHSRFCGKGCVIFGNGIAVFTLCASLCKAPIKMSEPCNRKILFVQFEKCMCTIQKPPFSAS